MGRELTRRVQENTAPAAEDQKKDAPPSLGQRITALRDQFQLAMPRGAEAAQLVRDALTCLRTTPKLTMCDPDSVLGGLMTCAQLGLRPGVLGHAWLLPFWDKNLVWTDENGRTRRGGHRAQLIIGYQGYRELAQRTGQIATLTGRVVHEHDQFDLEYGLADNIVHRPRLDGPRGEAVGYYAVVKYTSGGYNLWHLSKAEAEEHRDRFAMARNKAGEVVGPWRDNFDEMAVKTAFLRLARWMPKSTELASAIEADGSVRVDLTPDNLDAMLHAEHPEPDAIDGEVVDEQGQADGDPLRPDDPDLTAHLNKQEGGGTS
ncbi:recombinase RecT [Amycolatopsis suaedae]|uniref:Recombinase n=1 Tax=Amycolatopsis suaedae TaxID=2510978 RepID=A0A4Q7IXX9_9PSEU|nr:recombinase RecT [Amycolatopsis suaedae]RZQ59811.1 recombinase [Amycolatopsis suaedae]